MNLNSYIDLTQAISEYQKRGFTRTFSFINKSIRCHQTQKNYLAHEIEIVEYDRFVGDNLTPDDSIIFAISCHDGEQGYIISSERDMASLHLRKFMDKVKIQRRRNIISTPNLDMSQPSN